MMDPRREGFSLPDFSAPLDVKRQIALVPDRAQVKGMFLTSMVEEVRRKGGIRDGSPLAAHGPWRGFKDYPLREMMEVAVLAAAALYPKEPVREGLRRLGQLAYPTLFRSLVGRVIFAALGSDVAAVVRAASKGYAVSLTVGRAVIVDVRETWGIVRLVDIYNFPDCYQVGVFEGALGMYVRAPEVLYRPVSPTEGDIFARWG